MTEKERKGVYQRVFESEDGRAVLEDLRAMAFFDSYGISDDDRRLCYLQGRRSVVGHILETISIKVKNERRNTDGTDS